MVCLRHFQSLDLHTGWSEEGNMSAVSFTAVLYAANLKGDHAKEVCHHRYLRFVSNHLDHFKPLALILPGQCM